MHEEAIESEIDELVLDEGFRRCSYKDSLGKSTIGFGHLLVEDDKLYKQQINGKRLCINGHDAIKQLREDYNHAYNSVVSEYPWAEGDVRLVLVNMTFQLGVTGVSKFKLALLHLKEQDYDSAAAEMLESTWARQTPNRAVKLVGRIMSLN